MSDGYLFSSDGGLDMYTAEEAEYLAVQARKSVEPCFGAEVYVVNVSGKEIYLFEVYAKGKEFFIPKGADSLKPEYKEIRFDEYGERWFFDFEEAKARLYQYLTEEEEIIEGDDDWWYAEAISDGNG